MRHLLSIDDLSPDEILALTDSLPLEREPAPQLLRGTLGLMFQQPSLRTMSSFARAGVRLGLAPVMVPATDSSFSVRCDFDDEIRQLAMTSSCVVVRRDRPLDSVALQWCEAPVVNAGDGFNEHPTQALLDVATMRTFGLEGKQVVLLGNLRDHRVQHSLAKALSKLAVAFTAVCPSGFGMDRRFLAPGMECLCTSSKRDVDEVLAAADFVYLTPATYYDHPGMEDTDAYRLDLARARRVLKPSARVLHPFPRLDELAMDLDATEYNAYHRATRMGPPMRWRVLRWLIDGALPESTRPGRRALAPLDRRGRD